MKTIFKLTVSITIAFLAASICDAFAYSISTKDHVITVKMNHPSVIGIVGDCDVYWSDQPDDIGRDIYNSFVGFFDSRKKGTYTVEVYWKLEDKYGNPTWKYAGAWSFEAEELRKYKSYGRSKVHYRDVEFIMYEMLWKSIK